MACEIEEQTAWEHHCWHGLERLRWWRLRCWSGVELMMMEEEED